MKKMVKRIIKVNKEDFPEDYQTLTHNDITYQKGDPINIQGERGHFKFWSWQTNANGRVIVCVWWENHHFRHFYIDRVLGPKTKKKTSKRAITYLCDEHPSYGALRRPRTGCVTCWNAFEARGGGKKDKPSKTKSLTMKKVEVIPDEAV